MDSACFICLVIALVVVTAVILFLVIRKPTAARSPDQLIVSPTSDRMIPSPSLSYPLDVSYCNFNSVKRQDAECQTDNWSLHQDNKHEAIASYDINDPNPLDRVLPANHQLDDLQIESRIQHQDDQDPIIDNSAPDNLFPLKEIPSINNIYLLYHDGTQTSLGYEYPIVADADLSHSMLVAQTVTGLNILQSGFDSFSFSWRRMDGAQHRGFRSSIKKDGQPIAFSFSNEHGCCIITLSFYDKSDLEIQINLTLEDKTQLSLETS